jgi:hypothetical protein
MYNQQVLKVMQAMEYWSFLLYFDRRVLFGLAACAAALGGVGHLGSNPPS